MALRKGMMGSRIKLSNEKLRKLSASQSMKMIKSVWIRLARHASDINYKFIQNLARNSKRKRLLKT
jgi:hypothetical protein